MSDKLQNLTIFEKYLSVWVIFSIMAGLLGWRILLPTVPQLNNFFLNYSDFPIKIILFLMIYSILLNIDLGNLKALPQIKRISIVSSLLNWALKPALILSIAILAKGVFLKEIFYGMGLEYNDTSLTLPSLYFTGALLLVLSPGSAITWSNHTSMDPQKSSALNALQLCLFILIFPFLAAFLLGKNNTPIQSTLIFKNTVLFFVLPLALSFLSRIFIKKLISDTFFNDKFLPFFLTVSKLCVVILLLSLYLYKANTLIFKPHSIVLISVTILVTSIVILFCMKILRHLLKIPREEAQGTGIFCASSNFHIAFTMGVLFFGLHSIPALAISIWLLIEVPLMFWFLEIMRK